MIALDPTETRHALAFPSLIEALDVGFRADYVVPLRHQHTMSNEQEADAVFLLMPAWRDAGYGGIKIVNVVPGNNVRGLASVSSSYILFDRTTGQHLLMVDGGEMTARRTAAASALAAKRIARPNSSKLLVVGAGQVGQNLPYAYRAVLPISEVLIYDVNLTAANTLAVALETDGISARVVNNIEIAVREADIISCATLSNEPIVRGEWLSGGQHVDLIGSFTPEMREADDEVVRRARVFVDTTHAFDESGDLIEPVANGVLSKSDLAGTLVDLCRNDLYRDVNCDDITLFKSVGTAIEDLIAAELIFDQILARADTPPSSLDGCPSH